MSRPICNVQYSDLYSSVTECVTVTRDGELQLILGLSCYLMFSSCCHRMFDSSFSEMPAVCRCTTAAAAAACEVILLLLMQWLVAQTYCSSCQYKKGGSKCCQQEKLNVLQSWLVIWSAAVANTPHISRTICHVMAQTLCTSIQINSYKNLINSSSSSTKRHCSIYHNY